MATAWREYDLILHIGAPKTGTSAIQKFCNDNRAALLAKMSSRILAG